MAGNLVGPLWEATITNAGVEFTSADTTAKKTLITGGSNGSRVDSIPCSTNDTTAVNLAFYINISGTDYYMGVVNVPIGSGYTTVARVEALTTLAPRLGYIPLGNGDIIKVACVATMTAAKTTDVVALAAGF